VYKGSLYYAKDAFEGLEVMEKVMSKSPRPERRLFASSDEHSKAPADAVTVASVGAAASSTAAAVARELPAASGNGRPAPEVDEPQLGAPQMERDFQYPTAPFLGARLVEAINLQSVLPYINDITLFQFQWGYRRKNKSVADYKKFIDEHVRPIFYELGRQCAKEQILKPVAAYGYWRCIPEGNTLVLLDPKDDGKTAARFTFPRQRGKKNLCITDFFRQDGEPDVVALQVVTVGQRCSEVAREWFAADRYQDYLHLHGLSVEAAEGLAELIHRQIRGELGIAGDDAREMRDMFKQGYRGSRYSFGYPACPNLEDQALLLDLLGASRLGLTLSEEFQLDPEQSTSALVCHHPRAKYFSI
jgi:5-methyltetrahydrofolate--homocysteine methyltransferase